MSKRPSDDEESKHVARTGLGGGQYMPLLHIPSGGAHSTSLSSATFERYARPQPVVVKVHTVRHHSSQRAVNPSVVTCPTTREVVTCDI